MAIEFKRATRAQVPLKLGISGPSGSGKTTAALKLARGLVGPEAPIALLDTENGSASLYADLTEFDTLNMNPPYQVKKFTDSIDAAVQAGYKALVIDSATHEWKELLAEKEALDARGGNSYANWAGITKKHEAFLTAIQNAPIHLVICLRAKDKHEITEKDGKKSVVKLGQGSEMRDGFEYQLTTVWDLAMDHNASTSKDRTRMFDGRIEKITEATGRELADWLSSGKPLAENTGEAFQPTTHTTPAPATAPQASALPAAKVEPRATTPRAPMGAAQPVAQGAQAPTTSEPPAAWVEAMTEMAAVTVGMPELTRSKLIAEWEASGPAELEALKKEIASIRQLVDQPEPTTVGGAIAQLPPPPKAPVSQAAASFVDGVDPDTDTANGGINRDQYDALNTLIEAYGINRDALRSYCAKAGHLLPSTNGPTLARMKAEEFAKLRDKLCNQKIAAGRETWSARTVRIINACPITAFQPVAAAC